MKWVAVLLLVALAIDGLPALNLGHSQGTASETDNEKTSGRGLKGVSKDDSVTFSKTASQDEQSREQNQLSSLARSENQVGSSNTQSDSERQRSEEAERNRSGQDSRSLSSGGLNNLLQSQQTSRRRGDETRNTEEYNRDHFSSYDRNGGNTRSVDSVDESGNQYQSKRSYDEDSNRNFGLGNGGLTDSRSDSRSTSQSETNNAFKRNQRAQEETSQQDGSTLYRKSLSGSNEESKEFQQSSSQSAYNNQEPSYRGIGSPGFLNNGKNQDTSGQYNIRNLLGSPGSPTDFNRGPVHPMRHSPVSYIPTQGNSDSLYNQNHNYGTDYGNYGSHPETYGGRYTPNLGNHDGRHGIWNHAQNNDQLLRREPEPYRNNNFGTGFQGANPADYINQNRRINNPMQFSGYEYQPSGINEFPRRVPNQNQGREDFSDNLRQGPNQPRFSNGIGNQGFIDSGKYLNGLPFRNGPSSNSNEYLNGLLNHARATVNYPGTANPGINVNRGLFQGGPSNANQYPIETEDANTKYISDILSKAQYLLKHGTLPNGNGFTPAHHHPTSIIEPVYEVPNQGIRFFEAPVGSYIANPSSATNDDGFREVVPEYVVPAIIVPEQNAYPNAPFYTPNYGGFGPVVEYLPGTDGISPTTIFGRSPAYSVAPVLPINTIPVNNDRTGLLVDRALTYAPLPPLAPVVPLTPLTPVQPFNNAIEGPRGDASDTSAIITDGTVLPINTIPVNNDRTGLLVDRTLTYTPLTPLAPVVPLTPLTPETSSNDSEGTSGDASAIMTNRKVLQEYDTTYGPTTFDKGLRFANTHGIRYPDVDNEDTSRDVNDGLLDKSVKKHTHKNSRNTETIENTSTKITSVTEKNENTVVIDKEDDRTTSEDGKTIVIDNNNVIENNGGKRDPTVERIKKGLDIKDRSISKDDETIKNSTEEITEKNTYKAGKDKGIKDKAVVGIKKDSEKDNGSDNKDKEKTTKKIKPIETNKTKVRNIDEDDKIQNIKDETDKDGKYKGITDKAIEINKMNLEKGDDSNNKHTGKTKSNQPIAIKKHTAPENTDKDKSIKTILIDKTIKNTYRDANDNGKRETTITEINNNVSDKTTLSKKSENEKEKTVKVTRKVSGNNEKSSPIGSKDDKIAEKSKPIVVNNTVINKSDNGSGINNKTVDKNKTVLNKDDRPDVVDKNDEKNTTPAKQIVTGNITGIKKRLEKDDKGNDKNKKPAKSIVDKANQIKDAGKPNETDKKIDDTIKNDKTTIKNKTAKDRPENVAGFEDDDQCNDEDCDNDGYNKNNNDDDSYEDEVGDENDEITETDKDEKSEDGKHKLINKKPVLDNKPKNGDVDKKTITEIKKVSKTDNNYVTDKTIASKKTENEKEKTLKESKNVLESNNKSSLIDSKDDQTTEKSKPVIVNNTAINNFDKGSGKNNKTVDKNNTVLKKDYRPVVIDKNEDKNIKLVKPIVTENVTNIKKEFEKDEKGNDKNKKPAKSVVDKANQIKDAGRPNATDKKIDDTIKNDKITSKFVTLDKTSENRPKNVASSEDDDQCNDEDCNNNDKNDDDDNSYEDEVSDENDEISKTDKDKMSEDGKQTLINKKPVLDNKPKKGDVDKKTITEIKKVSKTDNNYVTDKTTASKKTENEKEKTLKESKKVLESNDKSSPIENKDDKTTEKSKSIGVNNTAINNSDKGSGINNKTVNKIKTVSNKDDRPDVVDKNDKKNTKPVTQIVTENKKDLEKDDKGNDNNKKPAKSIVDKANQIKDAGRPNATDKKIDDTIKNDKTTIKNKTAENRPKNVAGSEEDDQCNDEDCDNDGYNKNNNDDNSYEDEVDDENDEITETDKDKKSEDGKYTLVNKKPVLDNKPKNGDNDEKTTTEIKKVSGTDNNNVTDKTTVSEKSENAKEKTVMVTEKISGSNEKSSTIDSKDDKTTKKSKPIVANNTAINNSDNGSGINNKTVDKNNQVLKKDDRSDIIDKSNTKPDKENVTKPVQENDTKPVKENDTKPVKENNTKPDTKLGNYKPPSFENRDDKNVDKATKKQPVPDKNKRDASGKEVKPDSTTRKPQSKNIEIGPKYNEKDDSVKTPKNVAGSEEYDQCNDENCDNENKNDDDDDSYEDEVDDENYEITETDKNKKVSKTDNNNVTEKTPLSKKSENEKKKTVTVTKKVSGNNDKSSPIESKDDKTTEKSKSIVVNNTAINNSDKGSGINNKTVDKNKTVSNKDDRPDVVDKNDKKNTKPVTQIVTGNKKEFEKDDKGNDNNNKPAKSIVNKAIQIKDAGRPNANDKKIDDTIKNDKTAIKNKTAENRPKNVPGSEQDDQCNDEDCDNDGYNKNNNDDDSYEDEVDDENDEITETDKDKKSKDGNYNLIKKKPVLGNKPKNGDDDEKTITKIEKVSRSDNNNVTDQTTVSKKSENEKGKTVKVTKKVSGNTDKSSSIDTKDDKTTEKSKPIVVNDNNNVIDKTNVSKKSENGKEKTVKETKKVFESNDRSNPIESKNNKTTKNVTVFQPVPDKNKWDAISKEVNSDATTGELQYKIIEIGTEYNEKDESVKTNKNVAGSEDDDQCNDGDCDNDGDDYDDADDDNEAFAKTDNNRKPESNDEKNNEIVTNIQKEIVKGKRGQQNDQETDTADSESDEDFNKNELMKNNYGKKGESVSVDNTYSEEYDDDDDDDDENDAINSSDEVKKSVNNGSTKYETIKKIKKDFELKIPNNDLGTGSVDAGNDKIAEDVKSTLTNNKPVSDSQPKNGDDDKDDLSGKTEKGKKPKTYNGDKHKIVLEVIKGKQDQQNDQENYSAESESDEDLNKNELTKNSDDKKDGSISDDDTYIEKYGDSDEDDTDSDDENDTSDRSDQVKKLGSNSKTKYETIKEFEKDLELTRLKNNHRTGSANSKNDAILKDENSSVFDDEYEGDKDWWYYNNEDRKTKKSESNSGKDKKAIESEIDQKRKKDGSEVTLDDTSNEDSQSSSLELSSSFDDDESQKTVNSDNGDQNENDDETSRPDNGNKPTRNRNNKHNISTKIDTRVGQKDQNNNPETDTAVSDKTFGKLDGSDNDADFSIENYDDDDDDDDDVDLFDKSPKSSKYGNRKDKKVRGSQNSNDSGIEDRYENGDDKGGQSVRNDDKERQIVKKEPTIIVLEKDGQNENYEDQGDKDWWLYNNEDEKTKKPERKGGKDKKAIKSENGEGFGQKDRDDKVNGTDKSGIGKPARNDNDARNDDFSSESSDENYDDDNDDYDYEYDVSDKSGETDQSGRNYGNKKKQVEGCGTDDSCSNVNRKDDSDRTSKLPARKGDEKSKIVTKIGTTVVEKKDNRSNSANSSDKNGNSDAKKSDSTIKAEPRNDENNKTGNKDKNLVGTKNGNVSSHENCDDDNKTEQPGKDARPGRIGGQKHNTGQKGQKNGNCKDSENSKNNETFIDGTSTGDRKSKDDKREEIDKIWRAKNYTDNEKHLTKTKQDVESSNGSGSDLKDDGKSLKNSKSKDLHKKVITKIDAHKIRTKNSKPTQQKNDDNTTAVNKTTNKKNNDNTGKNESNNKTTVHESIGHKNEDVSSAEDIETSEDGESAVAGKQSKNKKHNQGDVVSNDTKDEPSNGSTRKHVVSENNDGSTTDTTSTTDANASKPKTLDEKDTAPDSKNNSSEDNRSDMESKSKNDSKSKTDKSTDTEEKKDTTSGSKDDGTNNRQSAATYYTIAGIKIKTDNGYKTINPKKRKSATIKIIIKHHKNYNTPSDTEDDHNVAGTKTTTKCAPGKATRTDDGQEKTQNNDGDENFNEESSTSLNKEKSESQSYDNTKESSTSSTGNKNNDKSNSQSDDSKNSNRSKSRTEEYSESSSGYGSSSESESITKDENKKSSQDKDHSKQKEDSKFTEETTYSNGKTIQSEQSSVSEVSDKISSDNYAEESDGNGNEDKTNQKSSSSESKIVDSNGDTKESKSSSTRKSDHSNQSPSSEFKSINQ